ncbi:COG4223 family protein [Pelagibius sp. Alg239-R121]|uniref:COG4223 family protein n=1 Tax=Pelagibius sp. Alg239-R121 TaxID=2993448 RepID=UPI0024A6102A|nr:mitofilin family membrane protein [Pelagibius sp. Alg239-R121]
MADKKEPTDRSSAEPGKITGTDATAAQPRGPQPGGVQPGEVQPGGVQPVAAIIEAFGGLRPMAGKLKVAVSTVQGWKERDSIPTARHGDIQAAAKSHNIALDPAVLSASDHMARDHSAVTSGPTSAQVTNGSKDQDVKKEETAPAAKDKAETAKEPAAKSAIPAAGAAKTASGDKPAAATKPEGASEKSSASKQQEIKKPEPNQPEPNQAASRPAPKPKSSGWLGGFVMGVVVLALVLAGVVYTRSFWLPLVEGLPVMAGGAATGADAGDEETAARIAELEGKLAALESQVQAAPAVPDVDLTPLDEAIAAANQRIDALDGTLEQLLAGGVVIAPNADAGGSADAGSDGNGPAAGQAELAALKARLDELAGQIAAGSSSSGSTSEGTTQTATPEAAAAVSALTDRLAEMERTIAALPDPEARLGELDSRLAETEKGVAALPALESRLTTELAALNEALPKGPSQEAGDAAMFLALLQLREALSGSGSFETELSLVDGLAAEDAELKTALAPLAEHAASGIAGLQGLQASFKTMARKAVAASRGGESDDWASKTLRKISEVVSVRPVGLVEGEDAGAVLARAEVKLDAGDLAGAVMELDTLTGAAAENAAGWRSNAEARLQTQKALSLLAARAANLIGLGG